MLVRNLPDACVFVLETDQNNVYLLSGDIDKEDKRAAYRIGSGVKGDWKLFARPHREKIHGDCACIQLKVSFTVEK